MESEVTTYYKTEYGLFPAKEEHCFNCRYHMRWPKNPTRTAKCWLSEITTDVTGYCKGWKTLPTSEQD